MPLHIRKKPKSDPTAQPPAAKKAAGKAEAVHSAYTSSYAAPKEPYVPKPPCHVGRVLVMSHPSGAGLYIGGWSHDAAKGLDPTWAVIDLTGSQKPGPVVEVEPLNEAAKEAFAKAITQLSSPLHTGPWLRLPFRDYAVPALNRQDWVMLSQDIMKLLARGINVLVCCTGGHGRSGTTLAILVGLLAPHSWTAYDSPVLWLRAIYCQEAVETDAQAAYVRQILKLPPATHGEGRTRSEQSHFSGFGASEADTFEKLLKPGSSYKQDTLGAQCGPDEEDWFYTPFDKEPKK